jgi:hypothetical protein
MYFMMIPLFQIRDQFAVSDLPAFQILSLKAPVYLNSLLNKKLQSSGWLISAIAVRIQPLTLKKPQRLRGLLALP